MPEMYQDVVIKHFKALFKTECSPLSRILDFFTLFPLCSLNEVVLPCCGVSFSFYTAGHLVSFLHCQEWSTFLKGTIIHHQRHIFETCHHYVALFCSSLWSTSSPQSKPSATFYCFIILALLLFL